MKCNECGNQYAVRIRSGYTKTEKGEKKYYEQCDKCGGLVNFWFPDASVPKGGYFDEHLGTYVHSKRQKADLLRKKGWVECGDRRNPVLGKPMPYIPDPVKRQKFFKDNFGEN